MSFNEVPGQFYNNLKAHKYKIMKTELQDTAKVSDLSQLTLLDEIGPDSYQIEQKIIDGKSPRQLNASGILNIQLNSDQFQKFVNTRKDSDIVNVLNKFGRLPDEFNGQNTLIKLLNSKNKDIRLAAVENLAKLTDVNILPQFMKLLKKKGEFSEIRKESASAIGRMRSKSAIPTLIKLLEDFDPNVVLQAIRGLLVFRADNKIKEILLSLASHENEIIQKVIGTEFQQEKIGIGDYVDHVTSPEYMHNTVVHGDVREIIKLVPSGSIHLTFTSPPYYNARDYSIYKSYKNYLEFLETVFMEIYRITKEGRYFVLNTSPIIIPRVGRSYASKRYPIPYDLHAILNNIGWEFIDDIVWEKPEASAKNRISGFNQHRKPLTYKPNCVTECVMVYRKKSNKLIDWNIKQYDKEVIEKSLVRDDIFSSNVWKIDPVSDKVHSAPFPYELCNNIVKYYSFVGDLVFDPFGGSGTLGQAVVDNSRKFFITEISKEYVNRIGEKISNKNLIDNPIKFYNVLKFKQQVKKDRFNTENES